MTNKGLKKKLGAVISQAANKLKATESKKKKKKNSKKAKSAKGLSSSRAATFSMPSYLELPKDLRDLYSKHRANYRSGVQDKAIVSQFTENADAYAWALKVPEFMIPAKVPDNHLSASVVATSEYEVSIPVITDSVSGVKYAGVIVHGGVVSKVSTLSAAAGGVLTWGASSDDPMSSSFATNFEEYRPVTMATHFMNETPTLYVEGEVHTLRVMPSANDFSAVSSVPATVAALTNTRMTETFPWSDEVRVARLTSIPADSEDQPFVTTALLSSNLTAQLYLVRLSTTAASQNYLLRIYSTYELTPYQTTMNLFPVSADMGDPTKIAVAVAEAAGFLLNSGNTLNGLASALGTQDMTALLARGKQLYGFLQNLVLSGFSAVFSEQRRGHALLRAAIQSLRGTPHMDRIVDSLDRSFSDLTVALTDLHVIGSPSTSTVSEEKQDEVYFRVAPPSPINSQESMGEALLRDGKSLLARAVPAPLVSRQAGRP